MYHLTCPSCLDITDSPFVRSGAVVRCTKCEHKYRIKSSHFERTVHTGPRTLDETDTVLRSDSVDIDPEEMPPVSIDDEGNVVGLSGLSELMRVSDVADSDQDTDVSSTVHERAAKHSDNALPSAKPASTKTKRDTAAGTGRARAQRLKKKKQQKTYLMIGGTGVVLIVAVLVIVGMLSSGTPEVVDDKPETDNPGDDKPVLVDKPTPQPNPEDPNDPKDPDELKDPRLFVDPNTPEPNPEIKFVAPWDNANRVDPPIDVPAMLTPARPQVHEGWYVMNPPRGTADATGVSNVEMGQLEETDLGDGTTLLSSTITNSSDQMVERGELHLMLLDGAGNVFAETYVPLAMIAPRSRQPIAVSIPTRYWKRSRGPRAAVMVQAWADPVEPIEDVRLQPAGQGGSSALRVSVKNNTDKTLRGASILISAMSDEGKALANFFVEDESLYIRENQWLDLVLATPLHPNQKAAYWSVTVVPK